jgi:hypothetical protein
MAEDKRTPVTGFVIPHDVVVRENANEVVFVRRANSFYTFEGVGGAIWRLLGDGLSVQQIVVKISALFDAAPEQVTGDVEEFIKDLVDEGLLGFDSA